MMIQAAAAAVAFKVVVDLAAQGTESALGQLYTEAGRMYNKYTVPEALLEDALDIVHFNQYSRSLLVSDNAKSCVFDAGILATSKGKPKRMLPTSNQMLAMERLMELLIYVPKNYPTQVVVQSFTNPTPIATLGHPYAVSAIRINRRRIVAATCIGFYIYDLKNTCKLLHTITKSEIRAESLTVMDLSYTNSDFNPSFLAHASWTKDGELRVVDLKSFELQAKIQAHENPVAAISFNIDCTMLATASTRGTVIRVHSIQNSARLYEFSRGLVPVEIHCLAFSMNRKFLIATSNTETVHVFSLSAERALPASTLPVDSVDDSLGVYLDRQVQVYFPHAHEYIHRAGSFAYARLPFYGLKASTMVYTLGNKDYLLVASRDGFCYCFLIPPEGGDAKLHNKFSIRCDASRGGPVPSEKEGDDVVQK